MKNKNALWTVVAVLAVAVVSTAVYFGNTNTQKGSVFSSKQQSRSQPSIQVQQPLQIPGPSTRFIPILADFMIRESAANNVTLFNVGAAIKDENININVKIVYKFKNNYESVLNNPITGSELKRINENNGISLFLYPDQKDLDSIRVEVDPENKILESNENNNVLEMKF